MIEVVLNREKLSWLGKYGYTLVFDDTEHTYQVWGVDDVPLGKSGSDISWALNNAMKEHDTSFEDILEESGMALYFGLREAFDEYAGHELSGQECLQMLKDLKALNE